MRSVRRSGSGAPLPTLGVSIPRCSVTHYDEIHARRFDEVLRLLRNPHQQIEPIADLCGYSAPSFLKRIFKKKTGLTMRAWRKRAADRGPAA